MITINVKGVLIAGVCFGIMVSYFMVQSLLFIVAIQLDMRFGIVCGIVCNLFTWMLALGKARSR